MQDSVMQCRTVFHEIQYGTDQSVWEKMIQLQITFQQLDERLRKYDDSIMSNLISNAKFHVALKAYKQGFRHNPSNGKEGNEMHLLAARIGSPGATDLGYALLEAGVSLSIADHRGMNGLYSMVFAVMIPSNRNEATMNFLAACIQHASSEAVYAKNKAGVSAWDMIHNRCTEEIIQLVEQLHGKKN